MKGNTTIIIKTIFEELSKAGIETELIQLADIDIQPCDASATCKALFLLRRRWLWRLHAVLLTQRIDGSVAKFGTLLGLVIVFRPRKRGLVKIARFGQLTVDKDHLVLTALTHTHKPHRAYASRTCHGR